MDENSKQRPSFIIHLARNWFLCGLVAVVVAGLVAHQRLSSLAESKLLQSSIVAVVMWMMAAPIPLMLVRNALTRPWPSILATIINMGVLPLLALAASKFFNSELGGGLIVAAAIPCTLASAAVWTRKAGGDDTVAILVTLITNLGCAIITPAWLVLLLGRSVKMDLNSLVLNLLLLVVLPIVAAQCMRSSSRFAKWADRYKNLLATACQIGILTMVLIGSIQMGQRLSTAQIAMSWQEISKVVLAATALHLTALAIAWQAASFSRIERPQQIAVAFSGSQKTLMVGLKLAVDCGVSILPMIVYHVCQLILDSILADRWKRKPDKPLD